VRPLSGTMSSGYWAEDRTPTAIHPSSCGSAGSVRGLIVMVYRPEDIAVFVPETPTASAAAGSATCSWTTGRSSTPRIAQTASSTCGGS
jgi:hypothetical protein